MFCPNSLISVITVVAALIADECSDDDVNILSTSFSQLGDTLATILAVRQRDKSDQETESTSSSQPSSPADNSES